MIWRRSVCAFAFFVAAASAWACGDDSSDKASPCPKDNPECKELADVGSGKEAVGKRQCEQCHGDDMSGSVTKLSGIQPTPLGEEVELYPPNLTPDDETGIGKWTDDALALAIRTGVDDESQALCPQMQHFSDMKDFEVYSIVMYLRSLPKVKKKIPRSVCPPTKTKEQQNLGH
jgi:hypothetical protein